MNLSIISASVSMQGLQQKIDILSNNAANVNTTGYKKKEASFEDVLTNLTRQAEDFRLPGRMTQLGYTHGMGARLANMQINMTQGSLTATDQPYDIAIQGQGLFEIGIQSRDDQGNEVTELAWTRNGSFNISMDEDGNAVLATKDGHFVQSTDDESIIIPPNSRISIDEDGFIFAYDETDPTTDPLVLGQLKLVHVVRPQLLQEIGDNLFKIPEGLDRAEVLQDAYMMDDEDPNRITVKQGYIEQSNVNLSEEMTELLMLQRAFQLSSRALTSADNMMGLANNLRG